MSNVYITQQGLCPKLELVTAMSLGRLTIVNLSVTSALLSSMPFLLILLIYLICFRSTQYSYYMLQLALHTLLNTSYTYFLITIYMLIVFIYTISRIAPLLGQLSLNYLPISSCINLRALKYRLLSTQCCLYSVASASLLIL